MLVIRVVCSWILWAKPWNILWPKPYKSIRNIANKNEALQTSHSPCWLSEKTLRYLRNLSLIHLKIIIKSWSFTAFTKNEGYIVWWGTITSKFIKKGYELKKNMPAHSSREVLVLFGSLTSWGSKDLPRDCQKNWWQLQCSSQRRKGAHTQSSPTTGCSR